jgi:hypothetical protein
MRKGFDGLYVLVLEEMGLAPRLGLPTDTDNVILPEIWTRGLVKKESNFTKRYEKTDPSKIFA